jgi:hypothetical protein
MVARSSWVVIVAYSLDFAHVLLADVAYTPFHPCYVAHLELSSRS